MIVPDLIALGLIVWMALWHQHILTHPRTCKIIPQYSSQTLLVKLASHLTTTCLEPCRMPIAVRPPWRAGDVSGFVRRVPPHYSSMYASYAKKNRQFICNKVVIAYFNSVLTLYFWSSRLVWCRFKLPNNVRISPAEKKCRHKLIMRGLGATLVFFTLAKDLQRCGALIVKYHSSGDIALMKTM